MSNDSIRIQYNESLTPLEALMSGVERAGDFWAAGSEEIPMPRIEVEGIGVLSFPVPEFQVQQLIQHAVRAPYGRGADTILDESVRKVWQLPSSHVRISGKSWPDTFSRILERVSTGLGCGGISICAELYKLLIYDTGGFFLSHRDTEKAPGMFGTLVVVLPSFHHGGELIVRHAGREITIALETNEISEMRFAAFYADCEHEVRPVREGNRICLVFNLMQQGVRNTESLSAPGYDKQIEEAAKLLTDHFLLPDAPAKIAWLLDHQYSPDGLSFSGLKSIDTARARVLVQAAERSDCAAHLAIVHIEESGAAEEIYGGPRRRYYDYHVEDEDAGDTEFEIIEVFERCHYVAQWRDSDDKAVDYGELPLAPGELLPSGALDREKPDEQRLMEASGNEGATFERSYHRAALVIWPRARHADVLLQAGVAAALPYLRERIQATDRTATVLARKIIDLWNAPDADRLIPQHNAPDRIEMLELLHRLGNADLTERFIERVVAVEFDGTENGLLAPSLACLGSRTGGLLLGRIIEKNMRSFHCACIELLASMMAATGRERSPEWISAITSAAETATDLLAVIETTPGVTSHANWKRLSNAKPLDARTLAKFFDLLRELNQPTLQTLAAEVVICDTTIFDVGTLVVPAIVHLREELLEHFIKDSVCNSLWVHAATFLLGRSERPPARPTDWRMNANLGCRCEDCRALEEFLASPTELVIRFPIRQERRRHLHSQIDSHGLDLTHVTERKGRPQTLVCAKTLGAYYRACARYEADRNSMRALLDVAEPIPSGLSSLATRLRAVVDAKTTTD